MSSYAASKNRACGPRSADPLRLRQPQIIDEPAEPGIGRSTGTARAGEGRLLHLRRDSQELQDRTLDLRPVRGRRLCFELASACSRYEVLTAPAAPPLLRV
ncbi:hypothetical protein [Streptomyces sp. NBC_00334]|uniref:hypothetical protein n=1 Tax=Streptomyces sp. NBC_00334 TaxID=2975713 RepID=UPI002E2B97E1|nr:hypothetical protein [Streptomyces sp. NBC_00334]